MKAFIKFVNWFSNAARIIVEAGIILIMVLTVADVVMRYTVKVGIMGVTEYSQMIMAIILLATASTGMEDNHIKVDILYNYINVKNKKLCLFITYICSIFISAMIATRTYYEVGRAIRDHITYLTLGWPQWPFYLLYAIAMTGLCLCSMALVFKLIIGDKSDILHSDMEKDFEKGGE